MFRIVGLVVLISLVTFVGCTRTATKTPQSASDDQVLGSPRHALLDEVVFTRENAKGQMTELVSSGSHQLAAMGISDVTTFRKIRDSEKIAYDSSYGSSTELTLNVAGPTFADGRLNPFHVPKIREALNWLIDRQYVVDEIYGGLAAPRYLPMNTLFPDNARLAETVRQLEVKYGHNPGLAEQVIAAELQKLGAEKVKGLWHHEGQPLEIKLLIRIEDQRRLIGDYLGDLLHDMGFKVDRQYRSAGEASRLWLAGDPTAGEWQIYTGGWGALFINRDLANVFNFFHTSRGRPSGLWQLYTPTPEFDALAERLNRRDYKSWEERQDMMRRGLVLSVEDSTRIWIADQISAWARSPDISLATDLAGGVTGASLWPLTLKYNDRSGGRLKIATPVLLADPFNPIAGTNWIYDVMVIRGLTDYPVVSDPYTGLFLPQQVESAEVTVLDGLVVNATLDWLTLKRASEITVPPDSWIDWDSDAERWITVGEKYPEGLNTDNIVRIQYPADFLQRRWHDGSQRSVADIVLQWILTFERGNPDSAMHDPSLVPAFALYQKTFHGARIVSQDPLILEFYGGAVHPDAETMVAFRSPGYRGTPGIQDIHVPWHTLALAVRAESQGDLALSSSKADKQRVEWTNLVDGPSLEALDRHLQQAKATNYLPFSNTLSQFVSDNEIEARYKALSDWRQTRKHFWVGDGPYYLHAVHSVEGSLVLRQSPTYNQPVDRWLGFSKPRIPVFDIVGPMVVGLDQAASFDIDVRYDGQPYPTTDIEAVNYMVFNNRSEMVASEKATLTDSGKWQINLDQQLLTSLGIGGNRIEVAVIAKPVAMPTFATHGFATVPAAAMVADMESSEPARVSSD